MEEYCFYSSVPGRALRTYGNAYDKHDTTRFTEWKEDKNSKAAVSASYPHDVINTVFDGMSARSECDWALAQKQWDSLPDYIKEGENILPMADVFWKYVWSSYVSFSFPWNVFS